MAVLTPTTEQQPAIDCDQSCVISAKPGSGKTFVVSHKIRNLLRQLPAHRGVIAISYTNKASDELKKRCLLGGLPRKASFFGTIDSFSLTEIIAPFGRHLFGRPSRKLETIKLLEYFGEGNVPTALHGSDWQGRRLTDDALRLLTEHYLQGRVFLETYGVLALHIFCRSKACQNYLQAKYCSVFVDEYQDSGWAQHQLFLQLMGLGLIATAVGDLDQSIYGFSGRSPEFLASLIGESDFQKFSLDTCQRCHPSIFDYAVKFLDPKHTCREVEKRVAWHQANGAEAEIGAWIGGKIPALEKKFQVALRREIGILCKSNDRLQRIAAGLTVPHRIVGSSVLDDEPSLWGQLFRSLLLVVFDISPVRFDFVQSSVKVSIKRRQDAKKLLAILAQLSKIPPNKLCQNVELFKDFAGLIHPDAPSSRAVSLLQCVLETPSQLDAFRPPAPDQIQLMTLHKSKGLEFDIVFHADLYAYILPGYKCKDEKQERNLHYVGVTRARKLCVLTTSTKRYLAKQSKHIDANVSEYVQRSDLAQLRLKCLS